MSKINTFEDAINILKRLQLEAIDVDRYEDDCCSDYSQIARVSQREIIDTLLCLEFPEETIRGTKKLKADIAKLKSAATADLTAELSRIDEELSNIMHPVSGARFQELIEYKKEIQSELNSR